MGSKKFTTVKSRALRYTKLDECGSVVFGSKSTIVSVGGFSKVDSKLDVQDGEKFQLPDAWGDFCVDEIDKPRILGADVTAEFCRVDPDAYGLAAGARVLPAGADDTFATTGDAIGYAVGTDTVSGDFALEAWTKIGGGVCVDGDPIWLWTCWPWLSNTVPGDLTLERAAGTFPMTSRARGASADWASGPYDEDSTVVAINAGEVYVQRLTLIQPPAATNGAVALVAP